MILPLRRNRPPPRLLPPMATARIVSISTSRSSVSWLIRPSRLTPMLPATATHTPRMIKLSSLINVVLIPFSFAALSLIPTACVISRRDVNRKTSAKMIAMMITISTGVGIGTPGMKPPHAEMMGLSTVGVAPPLIQYAIDRPQVYRINVAIMGCILNIATRDPLNAPKIIATTHAARKARTTVPPPISEADFSIFTNTLPAIAAAAPTLISCPPQAAVTRVIPIARIASSLAPLMMVIRFPERTAFPSILYLISIPKKLGSRIRLKITSKATAIRGMANGPKIAAKLLFLVFILRLTSCNRLHYLCLVQIRSCQFAYDMSVAHNDQPAAGTEHFLNLRGNKGYTHAIFRKLQHQLLDLQLGSYVDTTGGLIQDQIIRMGQKPSGQDHLLLITAQRLAATDGLEDTVHYLHGKDDILPDTEL